MLATLINPPVYEYVTDRPLCAVLWINHAGKGWSEKYYWPNLTEAQAYAQTKKLMTYRSWLLCQEAVIEWACLRQESPPWWEWPSIGAAIPDIGRWQPCTTPEHCILVGYRTHEARYGNKFVKGIPKDQIRACLDDNVPYHIPTIAPPEPDPLTASWPEIWRFFHCWVRDNTMKDQDGQPDGSIFAHPWRLTQWCTAVLRGFKKDDIGPAARRVSWEALVHSLAPPWTPCGMAVTALRACYASKVIWGPGWPTREINFYWAKPGVDVFQEKHVFWGWRRDRATQNVTGPGELVQHRQYLWSPGYSWGDAPGDHYCGLLSDFMGQRVWPPSAPTPAEILCVEDCDVSVPIPIRVDLSDNSVFDANTTHITFDVGDFTLDNTAPGHVTVHAVCACGPCGGDCDMWSTDVPYPTGNPFSVKTTDYAQNPQPGEDKYAYVFANIFSPDFSFSCWAKITATDSGNAYLFASNVANNAAFYIEYDLVTSGASFLNFWTPEGGLLTTQIPDPDGAWHHYGLAYSQIDGFGNRKCAFYYDGSQLIEVVQSVSPPVPLPNYTGFELISGHMIPTYELLWDDARVFDTYLGTSDFASIFANTFVPTPKHWWKCDEGAGAVCFNSGTETDPAILYPCALPLNAPCPAPTGGLAYGGTVLGGKVISLGTPITEIIGEPV